MSEYVVLRATWNGRRAMFDVSTPHTDEVDHDECCALLRSVDVFWELPRDTPIECIEIVAARPKSLSLDEMDEAVRFAVADQSWLLAYRSVTGGYLADEHEQWVIDAITNARMDDRRYFFCHYYEGRGPSIFLGRDGYTRARLIRDREV